MTCFAYETVVWQCSTKGHEDLFQSNFGNNNTYVWRDLWEITTKIKWAKLDGNVQLIFVIAAKVNAMV